MATINAYIFQVDMNDPPADPPLSTPAQGDVDHAQAIIDQAQLVGFDVQGYHAYGKWTLTVPDDVKAEWDAAIAQPGSGGGIMVNLGNGTMIGYDVY
jgi:hypothetical protein